MFGNLSLYKLVLLNWTTHFHDWNVFVPLMQQSMRKEDENKGCSDPCKKRFYQVTNNMSTQFACLFFFKSFHACAVVSVVTC